MWRLRALAWGPMEEKSMVKIKVTGADSGIIADIIAKALKDVGIKVGHWELDHDTPKEHAAVTRAANRMRAAVAIYELPGAH